MTTAAVVTLALGLGLTAVVVSLVNAVLLRPLAAPDPDRLVWVATRDDQSPFPMAMVVGPDFADWKAHARSFDRMVAYTIGDETIAASGTAARARIAQVTDDFWSLSGARLEHGRLATATEGPALVVSHRFFEGIFGGDPARLGGRVTVDRRAPRLSACSARFPFPISTVAVAARTPAHRRVLRDAGPNERPSDAAAELVARLQPDMSLEQARAEIDVLRTRAARPIRDAPAVGAADPVPARGGARRRRTARSRRAAPGRDVVLLIVCANIAGLRSDERRGGEANGGRTSLGATRARLARQLLPRAWCSRCSAPARARSRTVGLAPRSRWCRTRCRVSRKRRWTQGAGVHVAIGVRPPSVRVRSARAALDHAPGRSAEQIRAASTAGAESAHGALAGRDADALAFVLLAGAGLLLKSFSRLHAYPAGFHPDRVLVLNVQLSGPRYEEDAQRKAYATSFLDGLGGARRSPGIALHARRIDQHAEGRGAAAGHFGRTDGRSSTLITSTSAGLADVLGLETLSGRWLRDDEPAP